MRTMLIEEQIKIARMIASGTPREVALLEFVPSAKYMKKTGAASEDKPESKGKEEKKLSPSETSKAKLDAARKKIALDRKVEMLRRNRKSVPNAVADAITKTSYSKANTQTIDSKEGGATATGKAAANVAKTGVAATKNVAK